MTRWEDRNNTWYSYAYDEAGRCVFTTGTERALEYRYDYDPANLRTTATNSLGHATTYQMNDAWQVVAETGPLGHTTRKTWDEYNRPLTVTDPLGRTTRYEWDDDGNLTTLTRPDEHQITAEYNEYGQPTLIRQPDGTLWHHAYDTAGNRTSRADPDGSTTQYSHHPSGAVAAVTDSLGNVTRIVADAAGLATGVVSPAGARTSVERDAFGRPVTVADAAGAPTSMVWNPEGKPLRRIGPLGETEYFTWDPEGNLRTVTGPEGAQTTFTYGPFDLPATRTTPDGVTHRFTRDTELRLTQVANATTVEWSYTYAADGRLVNETDYDGRTVEYHYDAAGQLVRQVNSFGESIDYIHDLLGRLLKKSTSGGETFEFAYDLLGRVTRAESPGALLERSYTPAGLLNTETVNGRTLQLFYDPLARPTLRITPTGHESTWTYGVDGNPASLAGDGVLLSFDYDVVGRETLRRTDRGLRLSAEWDPSGRLTTQDLSTETQQVVTAQTYRHRADGLLAEVSDRRGSSRRFHFDALGRITEAMTKQGAETYAYDASGNLTDANWPVGTTPADAAGKRTYHGTLLVRAGAMRYEYDAAGRTTVRQKTRLSRKPDTWHYTWNVEGRLTRTVTPDGAVWTYSYDPFGRRISKQRLTPDGDIAERVVFTWHGDTLIEETSDDGRTLTWNHRGLTPLTQTESFPGQAECDRRFYVIVTDLVGSPMQLVGAQGDLAWEHQSSVWGVTTRSQGESATPLRFPGQYADQETGWHYSQHRHYDPDIARFATPDPLGIRPAADAYAYPRNPTRWVDPAGLAPHPPDRVYRSPHAGHKDNELANGLDRSRYQDEHGHAYVGEREVAQKYNGGSYESGYVEYVMRPEFGAEFSRYKKPHDGGPHSEWSIPEDRIPRFNELTEERNWINYYNGYEW